MPVFLFSYWRLAAKHKYGITVITIAFMKSSVLQKSEETGTFISIYGINWCSLLNNNLELSKFLNFHQ